jgi:hypothetical protein
MTNNFKHMCNGEYTFIYLANSTNRLIQIFKRLAIGSKSTIWLGKKQPFAPIAPPVDGGSNVQA